MTAADLAGNIGGAAFIFACASGVFTAGGDLLVGLPVTRMRPVRGLVIAGTWLALWIAHDLGLIGWWVAFGATMALILSVYIRGRDDDDDGSGGLRRVASALRRAREWLAVGTPAARPTLEPGR